MLTATNTIPLCILLWTVFALFISSAEAQNRVINSTDHLTRPVVLRIGDGNSLAVSSWDFSNGWKISTDTMVLPRNITAPGAASISSHGDIAFGRDNSIYWRFFGHDEWAHKTVQEDIRFLKWRPASRDILSVERNGEDRRKRNIRILSVDHDSITNNRLFEGIPGTQARWLGPNRIRVDGGGLFRCTWLDVQDQAVKMANFAFPEMDPLEEGEWEIEFFAGFAWIVDGERLCRFSNRQKMNCEPLHFVYDPQETAIRLRETDSLIWFFADNKVCALMPDGKIISDWVVLPHMPDVIGPTFDSDHMRGVYISLQDNTGFWVILETNRDLVLVD